MGGHDASPVLRPERVVLIPCLREPGQRAAIEIPTISTRRGVAAPGGVPGREASSQAAAAAKSAATTHGSQRSHTDVPDTGGVANVVARSSDRPVRTSSRMIRASAMSCSRFFGFRSRQ